jgi:hypothetical protein
MTVRKTPAAEALSTIDDAPSAVTESAAERIRAHLVAVLKRARTTASRRPGPVAG